MNNYIGDVIIHKSTQEDNDHFIRYNYKDDFIICFFPSFINRKLCIDQIDKNDYN